MAAVGQVAPAAEDRVRVDLWLWAVRVFKTRSLSTEACRSGHVRLNGRPAKASSLLKAGDRVTVRLPGIERVLEVRSAIAKRVGAAAAQQSYVDHSPAKPDPPQQPVVFDRPGRPTKRDRRQLDRVRRR